MADMTIDEAIEQFKEAQYGKDVRSGLVAVAETVKEAVENQLITVDSTLTESGQGADAKEVGDRFKTMVTIGSSTQENAITLNTSSPMTTVVIPDYNAITDLKSQISGIGGDVEIYVQGTSLIINTEVTNGNEVS